MAASRLPPACWSRLWTISCRIRKSHNVWRAAATPADVEIDTHEHALASQRAVRHVGEGGLRSAAEWGGVGWGVAGLRQARHERTLRWTLRTPHVRRAAGSRAVMRPLLVAASMAMPSKAPRGGTMPRSQYELRSPPHVMDGH